MPKLCRTPAREVHHFRETPNLPVLFPTKQTSSVSTSSSAEINTEGEACIGEGESQQTPTTSPNLLLPVFRPPNGMRSLLS
ncbi:hypothetical protein K443DRAFT_14640 [Laccaria amethystina LaAM-08-1]|uniref:Uncharacterized protein n=1 Tax=Laccaria amethystina LaAM-08-1 TaxID=1095629 RepID=A0A0C9WHG5_9AGAR|nr:hypothetical protein K443DRAFT_14640 [Laccaria amethystina LaAM-08-1]